MSPSGGSEAYWRDRAFLEAGRLVASETVLSQDEALARLQEECAAHPEATQRETLHAAVDRLIQQYPKPPPPDSEGPFRRLWNALWGRD